MKLKHTLKLWWERLRGPRLIWINDPAFTADLHSGALDPKGRPTRRLRINPKTLFQKRQRHVADFYTAIKSLRHVAFFAHDVWEVTRVVNPHGVSTEFFGKPVWSAPWWWPTTWKQVKLMAHSFKRIYFRRWKCFACVYSPHQPDANLDVFFKKDIFRITWKEFRSNEMMVRVFYGDLRIYVHQHALNDFRSAKRKANWALFRWLCQGHEPSTAGLHRWRLKQKRVEVRPDHFSV